MNIKSSSIQNVPAILDIIKDAQNYLKNLQIDQWQDGYPNQKQIELDINNKDSYVITNELNKVMGTVVFTTKPESTYNNIDGEWITEPQATYGVIHRLAVSDKFRSAGIARFVFDKCEQKLKDLKINSLRIDTHRDNIGMQKLITSMGYKYCGVIYLNSGAERLAFEKVLST